MFSRWVLAVVSAVLICGCKSPDVGAREDGGAAGGGLGAVVGQETGGPVSVEIESENAELAVMDEKIAHQQSLLEQNRAMINELKMHGMDVRSTKRGVVVNLPDVLFEFDSAQLKPDAVRAVRDIAEVLRKFPNRPVAVEGHTDAIGTVVYNQKLSEERARGVLEELATQGVLRRRLSMTGFGETQPVATNKTELGRKRNRRVEVIVETR